jgi:hypothetical protein
MIKPEELPDDQTFETVSRVGRIMHEFIARHETPLEYQGNFPKIANALIRSGAIVDEYGFQFLELSDLMVMLELSGYWFKYETDDNGNVNAVNKIDWSKKSWQ